MTVGLAPRPANEDRRVQAVIKTGLIDTPDNEIFQVYCDLAKDITGFDSAKFSLFDADIQCGIAYTGEKDFEVGERGKRHKNNICSYVLLDTEPLLMEDISKDPIWKNHPHILDGTSEYYGYAGFPVTNKDNFALGTLCMLNYLPKSLNHSQVDLIKKITSNMAHLLDIQIAQKEITSQKILEALISFQKFDGGLSISDLKTFISIISDLKVESSEARFLIEKGLCKLNSNETIELSSSGMKLQLDMKLESKPMKKIKLSGDAANSLMDEMFASLN